MQPARGNGAGTVLICGAGIAGTVVAYRLARAGLRPTVVERSADLRQAGNAVDLRGPALQVMADMGVLAELETRATQLSEFFRIDSSGKRVFTMAPHVIGGEIELLRTELNAVLFNAAQTGVEYRFGDSIRSLHERGDDVAVTFDSGRHGHFDVVIGADGLHSRTRTLAFGPESDFVRHLGCYQAHFTTGNVLGLRNAGLLLNRPGRTL
ncbi:FAD-dependent oxidoreductase, partial [Mycobacteroides abscessus]